jgi:ribosomal peptide maturation radical SAM protein 1
VTRLALVSMPFAPATRPSLQLGILKALASRSGIQADCYNLAIDFYQKMRQKGYHHQYTSQVPSLVYEWYFSPRPFDPRPVGPDFVAVMRLQAYCQAVGFAWSSMLDVKQNLVPQFLAGAEAIDWSPYDVVAFTMTYPQITASVALARRIKERWPDKIVVFGGAGSQIHEESASELLRVFPWLDVGVVGEAEPVFVPLLERLAAGDSPEDLPGIFYRQKGEVRASRGCPPVYCLDDDVFPEFDDYFARLPRLDPATRGMMERVLPMEWGRGCAWGDKKTCTFCAFTFHGPFRRRSKERILAEVRHQIERYGVASLYLVDDLITNQMITEVFPELPALHPRLRITFMEMRTTGCTERHLDLLAQAGVQLVQPGIESMDDGLLERMSKGTTVFHNIMFMKGARERGIRVSHNLILGFPQATPQELERQYRNLRQILHLDPPFLIELSLVRYSPYWHQREKYGLYNWRPDDFYACIYPDGTDLERIAYEFHADCDHRPLEPLYRATVEFVREWQRSWNSPDPPFLWLEENPDGSALIRDGRLPGDPVLFPLDSLQARLYRSIMSRPLVPERMAEICGAPVCQVQALLEEWLEEGLVLESKGRYLALALDRARVEGRSPSRARPGDPSSRPAVPA